MAVFLSRSLAMGFSSLSSPDLIAPDAPVCHGHIHLFLYQQHTVIVIIIDRTRSIIIDTPSIISSSFYYGPLPLLLPGTSEASFRPDENPILSNSPGFLGVMLESKYNMVLLTPKKWVLMVLNILSPSFHPTLRSNVVKTYVQCDSIRGEAWGS